MRELHMWDDDDEAPSIRQCVDCRAVAPRTDTNYTLISSKYGWRLTRRTATDGSLVIEWRCPTCWEKYKAARPASAAIPPPSSRTGAELLGERRTATPVPPSRKVSEEAPPSRRPAAEPPPPARFEDPTPSRRGPPVEPRPPSSKRSPGDGPPRPPPPSRRFR